MTDIQEYVPTVLVVEDELPLQNAIEIKLKNEGYKVILAASAHEAAAALTKEIPDLIWLDLLLPGMDGLQFLQEMRAKEEWKHVPVIVVSVTAGQDKIQKAFDLNVIDFIIKSQYRIEDIIARVREFFEEKSRAPHTELN
jgi:DNA-binding response OmpR family regulator